MSGKTELKILTVEEIKAEAVKWLWEPYIALGKITLVSGDAGIGKSTMLLAVAADLTRGRCFGSSDICEPCDIIYQTVEDSYADTVKPRLQQLSADCTRVHVIDERERSLSLSDARIEEAITKTSAKLFIADPLQGYCIGSDMHSVNGMRPLMKRLGEVAERTGCAIILVSHLNKKGGQSQYRNLGSVDIYAAARSVLTVGELPLDPDTRIMLNVKNNLAPLGKPQAFGFDPASGFCWLGDCDATVDDVLSAKPKTESQLSKAQRLLRQELAHGAVLAIKVEQLADENGISFKTFKRAREIIGANAFRRTGKWYWELPIEVIYEDGGQADNGEACPANTLVVIDEMSA
jgi:hypothetical protein